MRALAEHGEMVLLIDEIQSNLTHCMWIPLLKRCRNSNLIIIGAAFPSVALTGLTAQFLAKWGGAELLLSVGDDDTKQLIEYWQNAAPAVAPAEGEATCNLLCDYCGGHVFALVQFLECFVTEGREHINELPMTLTSAAFRRSEVFNRVLSRCFQDAVGPDVLGMFTFQQTPRQ